MRLERRLTRLEDAQPDHDGRIRVIFIEFCWRDEADELRTRIGLAKPVGGEDLERGDDETEGAFARRVYGALAPDCDGKRLSGEDLEILAASKSEAVALAKLHDEEVTPEMITAALNEGDAA